MTLKDLSQLYYLNREIEMDQRRLEELRTKATNVTQTISDMPRASGVKDNVSKHAAETADLSVIISAKQQKCLLERNRLERYIANLNDSLTRQVFTLRFVNGLDWEDVAQHISERFTGKYVSNICYSQLKKDEFQEKEGG